MSRYLLAVMAVCCLAGCKTVAIQSSPSGASVYYNGEFKGKTPTTLNIRKEHKTGQNYFIFCFHKLLYATRCFDWLFSGSVSGAEVDSMANRTAGLDVRGWHMVLPSLPAVGWRAVAGESPMATGGFSMSNALLSTRVPILSARGFCGLSTCLPAGRPRCFWPGRPSRPVGVFCR